MGFQPLAFGGPGCDNTNNRNNGNNIAKLGIMIIIVIKAMIEIVKLIEIMARTVQMAMLHSSIAASIAKHACAECLKACVRVAFRAMMEIPKASLNLSSLTATQ